MKASYLATLSAATLILILFGSLTSSAQLVPGEKRGSEWLYRSKEFVISSRKPESQLESKSDPTLVTKIWFQSLRKAPSPPPPPVSGVTKTQIRFAPPPPPMKEIMRREHKKKKSHCKNCYDQSAPSPETEP